MNVHYAFPHPFYVYPSANYPAMPYVDGFWSNYLVARGGVDDVRSPASRTVVEAQRIEPSPPIYYYNNAFTSSSSKGEGVSQTSGSSETEENSVVGQRNSNVNAHGHDASRIKKNNNTPQITNVDTDCASCLLSLSKGEEDKEKRIYNKRDKGKIERMFKVISKFISFLPPL